MKALPVYTATLSSDEAHLLPEDVVAFRDAAGALRVRSTNYFQDLCWVDLVTWSGERFVAERIEEP